MYAQVRRLALKVSGQGSNPSIAHAASTANCAQSRFLMAAVAAASGVATVTWNWRKLLVSTSMRTSTGICAADKGSHHCLARHGR